ncbi:hypothetical protein ABZ383_06670 [Streptomyces sp. NPDC005900]|uniref:hypothetical protein n=1 Tax=Streptomyces sp. NPDC005900 TaxID=3154569 RepID=UPI0033F33352
MAQAYEAAGQLEQALGEAPLHPSLVRGHAVDGRGERPVPAYDRRIIEHLLPAVWDAETAYGIRNPQAPDADMPKGSVDPKTASLLFAHLADIRRGWAAAPLSLGEGQALILRAVRR